MLEIGTGWGGFALYAAEQCGCRVTTTTISREQHAYASARVQAAGLEDRVTVLLADYRDLIEGTYDKLVSIEMIEAVGWQTARDLLRALLRAAGTRRRDAPAGDRDRRPRLPRREGLEELHQHLHLPGRLPAFAGGDLPLTGARHRPAPGGARGHHSPLRADSRVLARALSGRLCASCRLGYDERFRRLWELYLCYCEGGFRERRIQDIQLLLAKPAYRSEPLPAETLLSLSASSTK